MIMIATNEIREEYIDKTAIATTTFYNPNTVAGRLRAGLALELITGAMERGYHMSIVDGGSSDEFLDEVQKRGAQLVVDPSLKMGPSRRKAIDLATATGREVVAWTEPEKVGYLHSIWTTTRDIVEEGYALIIPIRLSLDSYPWFQKRTELEANHLLAGVTGTYLDLMFGPRTWGAEHSHYFTQYDGRFGDQWESIFIPVVQMLAEGKKVGSVPVDYTHPLEQTRLESGNAEFDRKRELQRDQLMENVRQAWQEFKK